MRAALGSPPGVRAVSARVNSCMGRGLPPVGVSRPDRANLHSGALVSLAYSRSCWITLSISQI